MRLILAAALALLSGCAQYQQAADAYAQLGVKSLGDFKTTEAKLAIEAAGIAGVGAVGRTWTPKQAYHVLSLVWPEGYLDALIAEARARQTVDMETLRAVASVLTATQPPVALRR